jgi:hypothetical protein
MNVESRDAYTTALREDVCSICACFTPDPGFRHTCSHESTGACVIFSHLDDAVNIVTRFRDSDLAALDNAYQMYACTHCKLADVEGVCSLRNRTRPVPEWCIADAYLPQIVGAIERVLSLEVA